MWLSLITQAGVSLGLAGEINFMFHSTFGPACATAIVAVIMLNQIAGPILCKVAIKKVGEAYYSFFSSQFVLTLVLGWKS